MNLGVDRCRWWALMGASAIMLLFAGCGWSGTKTSADSGSAKSSDNAELFSIPKEQMAHVQVLTVQPATLARSLRLTGAVAYNSFRTTPVITQVSGPVAKIVVCLLYTSRCV